MDHLKNWKLTEKSPIIKSPSNMKLPLYRHQLAILHKCLQVEQQSKDIPFGVLADKPGSGKTAEIIALVSVEKQVLGKTKSLIVVPQNIHSQWITEFRKFAGDSISVKSFIEYEDITSLFYPKKVAEIMQYDVLITTLQYYDTVMSTLETAKINIRRIIFDEIDSMMYLIDKIEDKKQAQAKMIYQNLLAELEEISEMPEFREHKIQSQISRNSFEKDLALYKRLGGNASSYEDDHIVRSKIIWFISATFDNVIGKEGYQFRDRLITFPELQNVVCKCEDSFLNSSNVQLQDPIMNRIVCDSMVDIYYEYLSIDQLDFANSLSYQNIVGEYTKKRATCDADFGDILLDDYNQQLVDLKISLQNLQKNIHIEEVRMQANKIQKKIDFIYEIYNKFLAVKDNNKSKVVTNTKIVQMNNFLNNVKPEDKVLIFSDFSGAFKVIMNMMKKKNISYKELDGGNINDIDKILKTYKGGDTQVLLIDASTEGCGLNLENTTKLVFLHKTADILYSQIVGRAQRNGRTGRLEITVLLNNNEIV